MGDKERNQKITDLINLIFREVSELVLTTDLQKQAQHLTAIADYETRVNRLLCPEHFETFAA